MEKYLRRYHGFNDEMIAKFNELRRKSYDTPERIIITIKLMYSRVYCQHCGTETKATWYISGVPFCRWCYDKRRRERTIGVTK